MDTSKNSDGEYVFIDSMNKKIKILDIKDEDSQNQSIYEIGNGDQIAITVWGLPDVFPISNINPDQNLRRVDSNGNIYFPYIGLIKAQGKNQNSLRNDIASRLSNYFTDPQVDVSIARFNSQKIYMLGEVTRPMKINITDIPLSLSEAIGEVNGLNTNTSAGSEVYIIRQGTDQTDPIIFKANLNQPSGFIAAGEFYLKDNDIVYVNAKGTTRWNRVISQFFPFTTFLNSIDNLSNNN